MDNELAEILENILELLKAEEHIRYDETNGRWYCAGSCKVDMCPALRLEYILEERAYVGHDTEEE